MPRKSDILSDNFTVYYPSFYDYDDELFKDCCNFTIHECDTTQLMYIEYKLVSDPMPSRIKLNCIFCDVHKLKKYLVYRLVQAIKNTMQKSVLLSSKCFKPNILFPCCP